MPPKLSPEEKILAIERKKEYQRNYYLNKTKNNEIYKEKNRESSKEYYYRNKEKVVKKNNDRIKQSGYGQKYYIETIKPKQEEIKKIVSLVKELKLIV